MLGRTGVSSVRKKKRGGSNDRGRGGSNDRGAEEKKAPLLACGSSAGMWLCRFGLIWEWFGSLCGLSGVDLGQFGLIWADLGRFGLIWVDLGPSGSIWIGLGLLWG